MSIQKDESKSGLEISSRSEASRLPKHTATPKFSQSMTMHINGGRKFSELHYTVKMDGQECGITRHTRTNGSPEYLITADEFHCGEETFDVLQARGVGMVDWLKAHAKVKEPQ